MQLQVLLHYATQQKHYTALHLQLQPQVQLHLKHATLITLIALHHTTATPTIATYTTLHLQLQPQQLQLHCIRLLYTSYIALQLQLQLH